MKPKTKKVLESGPDVQQEDFEDSPDMAALDRLTRRVLSFQKPEATKRTAPAYPDLPMERAM